MPIYVQVNTPAQAFILVRDYLRLFAMFHNHDHWLIMLVLMLKLVLRDGLRLFCMHAPLITYVGENPFPKVFSKVFQPHRWWWFLTISTNQSFDSLFGDYHPNTYTEYWHKTQILFPSRVPYPFYWWGALPLLFRYLHQYVNKAILQKIQKWLSTCLTPIST